MKLSQMWNEEYGTWRAGPFPDVRNNWLDCGTYYPGVTITRVAA